MDDLLPPRTTVSQAAALCGVTGKTVLRWIKSGLLRAVKVGGRYRTTEAWIAESIRPCATAQHDTTPKERHDAENGYSQALKNIEARFRLKVSRSGVRS